MPSFLLAATALVLATVALGLVWVLRGPAQVDRMLAAQLFGTGGIAAFLLLGAAHGDIGELVDVALILALLAGFAAIAFVKAGVAAAADPADREEG